MIPFFWEMLPCYSVTGHQSFDATQRPNILEPIEFWRWNHYVVSKRRDPITRWRNIMSPKNGILRYAAATTLMYIADTNIYHASQGISRRRINWETKTAL